MVNGEGDGCTTATVDFLEFHSDEEVDTTATTAAPLYTPYSTSRLTRRRSGSSVSKGIYGAFDLIRNLMKRGREPTTEWIANQEISIIIQPRLLRVPVGQDAELDVTIQLAVYGFRLVCILTALTDGSGGIINNSNCPLFPPFFNRPKAKFSLRSSRVKLLTQPPESTSSSSSSLTSSKSAVPTKVTGFEFSFQFFSLIARMDEQPSTTAADALSVLCGVFSLLGDAIDDVRPLTSELSAMSRGALAEWSANAYRSKCGCDVLHDSSETSQEETLAGVLIECFESHRQPATWDWRRGFAFFTLGCLSSQFWCFTSCTSRCWRPVGKRLRAIGGWVASFLWRSAAPVSLGVCSVLEEVLIP